MFPAEPAQSDINHERNCESDKPRVVVDCSRETRARSAATSFTLTRKPGRFGSTARTSATIASEAEAVGETILAVGLVKRGEIQLRAAKDEVVGDQDAADRSEQRAVADEPGENVAARIGDQFPRHHQHADDAGDQPAHAEGNLARREMREIIRRADDVRRDVRRQRGDAEREHRDDQHARDS